MDAFAPIHCCLYIEDLYRVLSEYPPRSEDEGQFSPEAFEQLMATRTTVPFDVILAWDLLNYLDGATVKAIMTRVARRCRPGTVLFALTFMGREIPSHPGRCRIIGGTRLRIDPGSPQSMRNPRPSPTTLERMMAGFRLRHSFLSQVGVQEYLFGLA
ncbi:MAG: class I SAM-dependent methyltransferase [Gammaproteobacteria bacterium]|nr:class I SAM-dependent methyltransferase [Gammaproteobacteria bacterium]NIR85527.1 class I SAM-dependent methyltransferase [Gammaproteobacteria bacterium]NIR89786.1 class I SAM-dependent methyltransferase [Gammaproteobacteria bacterium]NIU06662.1 class I SAM-dependent methyltransferase [Gammaproteobacteria bacterium]NIV75053.1 hypothetical protein [Gammaproteobacteria bacterium]